MSVVRKTQLVLPTRQPANPPTRQLATLEAELKNIIIEALVLEDITPEEIKSEKILFGDGLGLDSIDALEVAMVLEKR